MTIAEVLGGCYANGPRIQQDQNAAARALLALGWERRRPYRKDDLGNMLIDKVTKAPVREWRYFRAVPPPPPEA